MAGGRTPSSGRQSCLLFGLHELRICELSFAVQLCQALEEGDELLWLRAIFFDLPVSHRLKRSLQPHG